MHGQASGRAKMIWYFRQELPLAGNRTRRSRRNLPRNCTKYIFRLKLTAGLDMFNLVMIMNNLGVHPVTELPIIVFALELTLFL